MKILKPNLQIAIDGPAGAGKSIGAYELAKRLGILYVYTGAMYRAVAWLGINQQISLTDEAKLLEVLKRAKIELHQPSQDDRVVDVWVNDQNVTAQLFLDKVNRGSSSVALLPKIRRYLVNLQKELAEKQAVVMEGRDIALVVLPQADLKIYMTADLQIRAQRRLKDHLKRGEKMTLDQVKKETEKRDFQDSHRKADPLKIAPGAWVFDTTNLSIEDEVNLIIARLKELRLVV